MYILMIFMVACSNEKGNEKENDDNISNKVDSTFDYIQLRVGNYWVYEIVSIDTSGLETFIRIDSVYIHSDSIIGEHTYYEYVEAPAFGITDTVIRFFRDSLGYLIDSKGTILFSDNNFTDTIRQIIDTGMYSINYVMEKAGEIIVPAGKFSNCLCYKGQIKIEPLFDNWQHPESHDNFYAPKIGKIKSTAFYITKPIVLERRLLRYKVID